MATAHLGSLVRVFVSRLSEGGAVKFFIRLQGEEVDQLSRRRADAIIIGPAGKGAPKSLARIDYT